MYPVGLYLLKVSNRNTRILCEICSKLTIKNPEKRRSGVFIKNFSTHFHTYSTHCSRVSIVDFEPMNAGWEYIKEVQEDKEDKKQT